MSDEDDAKGGFQRWWRGLFAPSAPELGAQSVDSVSAEDSSEAEIEGAQVEDANSESLIDNDSPIRSPAEDLFGVDRFAAMVARSLAAQRDADGTVVAIHGPWGSGKSSAVNLALHHLAAGTDNDVEVIAFNPWWFSGSSALAGAFFQTIGAALNRTLRDEGKAALGDFFARLKSFNTYADAAAKFASDGMGQAVAQLAFGERSIEDEHRKLAEALRSQPKSFVIVIDDIDRLSPDEALLIFGLVKSVGRLPKVSYLLAFDRILIERLIELRFPSEGKLYLEKIVQAMFDLPPPPDDVLRNMVLEQAFKLITVEDDSAVRFMNLFYDIIAPNLTSPRQAVRLNGALRVSWPSVAGEVDPADFVAVEALRLFHPALYRNVRQNADLCCSGNVTGRRDEERQAVAEEALFRDVEEGQRGFARTALRRLFPKLDGIWGNTHYGDDWTRIWESERLICTKKHFPIYFQYGLDEGGVPKELRDELIARAGDADFVRDTMRAAVAVTRRTGGTQAALILEELNLRSADVAGDHVEPLLATLFAMIDELDTEADHARGFEIGNNALRMHWLINRLLMERFTLEERSALLTRASENASPVWLADFAQRCFRPYDPDHEKKDRGIVLVSEETASLIMTRAKDRIRELAEAGELTTTSDSSALLWFLWHSGNEGKTAARTLGDAMMNEDRSTICLARSATSTSWSHGGGFDGMGDRVARSSPRVHPESLAKLLDADRLRARVLELLASQELEASDRVALDQFIKGWDADRRDRNDE